MEYKSNILEIGKRIYLEDGLSVDKDTNNVTANEDLYAIGNVGIGTTNPGSKLHVSSSATNTVEIYGSGNQTMFSYSDSGGVGWCTGEGAGNWTNLLYLDTNNDAVNIYANDSFHTTFNAQGYVGIGTTDPGAKLDVNGDINIPDQDSYKIGNTSVLTASTVTFDTFIGIGGALNVNPLTAEFTFNGTDVHWGSVANNFFSRKATLGVTESGLSEGSNGHRPEASFGEGLYYRNQNVPFAPVGYPDFQTSRDFSGFLVNGNIIGVDHNSPSADAANISSSSGFGDLARYSGSGSFEYTYGSGSVMVNPMMALFEVFGWAGSDKLQFDPFGANTLFAPSFTPTSDRKLKENITPVSNGLDIVCGLQGVEYDLKVNGKASSGFIAQDVEEVVPHAVVEKDDVLRLNYNALAAYHNEAIKELKGMIDELKSEIQQLKNKQND